MRRFVIGDIHGCSKALRTLIESIAPSGDDELVFLGDYIDRGPDSRDVVEQILELQSRCRVVALRGNHEIMLLGVALCGLDDTVWLQSGGQATVASYGGAVSKIPDRHLQFFRNLRPFYETDKNIFIHAGYAPDLPMPQQDEATAYWNHLSFPPLLPHRSGKRVFVGHTPQPDGNILDLGHLVCLDTYCFGGGYLTALEIDSYELIQADRHGHLRRDRAMALAALIGRLRRRVVAKLARSGGDAETQPGVAAPEN